MPARSAAAMSSSPLLAVDRRRPSTGSCAISLRHQRGVVSQAVRRCKGHRGRAGRGRGTRPGTCGCPSDRRTGSTAPRAQIVVCGRRPADARGDVVADVHEQVEVGLAGPGRPRCGAGLFSIQPEPSRHGVHWPHDSRWKKRVTRQAARTTQVRLVHHDDRRPSRASSRPRRSPRPGQGQVEVLRAEPRRRHAAGDERLELPVVADTAAERGVVDQVAEGDLAELDLVVAGAAARGPTGRTSACPVERPAPSAAKASPPLLMIQGRLDSVSTLLTTVGCAVEALCGREERRLDARASRACPRGSRAGPSPRRRCRRRRRGARRCRRENPSRGCCAPTAPCS